MALRGSTAQERAWNFFCDKGLNHYAISGIMASIRAESGFNPRNLQNSCEKKSGYTDATYTAAVDNGSYANFIRDSFWVWVCSVDLLEQKTESSQFCKEKKENPSETKKCSWNICGRNYLVHTRVF